MFGITSRTGFALVGLLFAASNASAVNTLTDPSFESNPLVPLVPAITNYPGFVGQWGHENSTIVTAQNSITPANGNLMLRVDSTGGGYSQTGQVIDLTSLGAQIDAGLVTYAGSALFNANLPAAQASVIAHFVDNTALHGNTTGPDNSTGNVTVNSNTADWESFGVNGIIPTGTRWVFFQVAYFDASLNNSAGAIEPGYVDSAVFDVRVAPEPTTLATLAGGALLANRRRRN